MFFFFITVLSRLSRRLIGERSATSLGPVPDRSATSCIKSQRGPYEVADQSPISRQPVPDQSPTSRRPTAKPSFDSSATSAIVLNFGRGEVAERLRRMSDWGLTEDAYSSGHVVRSHFGLAFVLMLRPFFPELVKSTDIWVSNIPRYFYFALLGI